MQCLTKFKLGDFYLNFLRPKHVLEKPAERPTNAGLQGTQMENPKQTLPDLIPSSKEDNTLSDDDDTEFTWTDGIDKTMDNPEKGQDKLKSSKNDYPSIQGKSGLDIGRYGTRGSKRRRMTDPVMDTDKTAGRLNQDKTDRSEEHAKTSEMNCEDCEKISDKSLLERHWYRAHKTYHCKLCKISFTGIRNGCKHYNPNVN